MAGQSGPAVATEVATSELVPRFGQELRLLGRGDPGPVTRDASDMGSRIAEHNKTPNGLWLRMEQITVEATVQFQIGEQRFQLKVP
jgi:hypothetical protein